MANYVHEYLSMIYISLKVTIRPFTVLFGSRRILLGEIFLDCLIFVVTNLLLRYELKRDFILTKTFFNK